MTLKKIEIADLICMDDLAGKYNFRVDLAYTRPDNFLFGEAIYKPDAKLYLHKDLANIVLAAAKSCYEETGLHFVLYDGLRTIEAQKKMMQTRRVLDNPHWLVEPRLLSPAGAGGHPRGMAIDIALADANGHLLDMGTPFDFLAENPHPAHNSAHRDYVGHNAQIMQNHAVLDKYMLKAAQKLKTPLFLLPQEWWDYRLPPEIFGQYAPLSDGDLPAHMRLVDINPCISPP